MSQLLDNPVWHAMISGNAALTQGTAAVKTFPPDISPIVGLAEYNTAHFNALHHLISFNRTALIFSVNALTIPGSWKIVLQLTGFQMIYTADALPEIESDNAVTSLTDEYISQMLALTKLTNPGPFSARTIDFGYYEGIFEDGKLVAMAGQRLHPYQYTEISAVCTHPNHAGKGYAKQLLLRQVHRMIIGGNIPLLHVKEENSKAINMYKRLGFEIRSGMFFYVLQKKG